MVYKPKPTPKPFILQHLDTPSPPRLREEKELPEKMSFDLNNFFIFFLLWFFISFLIYTIKKNHFLAPEGRGGSRSLKRKATAGAPSARERHQNPEDLPQKGPRVRQGRDRGALAKLGGVL